MSDEEVQPGTEPEPDEERAELESLAVDDGKGGKMVPLSALLDAKKSAKAHAKRVKELEPVAARATELDAQLSQASPFINAMMTSPKLRAEAMRLAGGTHASAPTTEQPAEDDDANAYAEDMGWYLSDGTTVDAARGRRVLDRLDQRHGRQTQEALRPLAGMTLNTQADANLARAIAMTDDEGVPLATPESIRDVASQLPANLLSNQKVIELVLRNAIGEDRIKGRTPKALDEPLYLERAGGRRQAQMTADDRDFLRRSGMKDTEFQETMTRLTQAKASGRGIALE